MALFCAAIRRDSVSFLRFPFIIIININTNICINIINYINNIYINITNVVVMTTGNFFLPKVSHTFLTKEQTVPQRLAN